MSREQVRAENKETLQAIIDNTDLSEEQKQDAISQMVKLTQMAEQEMAIETLLASKGFTQAVVNLTEDQADVVVEASDLDVYKRQLQKRSSEDGWTEKRSSCISERERY